MLCTHNHTIHSIVLFINVHLTVHIFYNKCTFYMQMFIKIVRKVIGMREIKSIEHFEKEIKNSEKVESDNIPQDTFEASISQDGRHLLCRLPIQMMEGLNILELVEDRGEQQTTKKLKDRLKKNWKIVFTNIDYEDRSGSFEIKERLYGKGYLTRKTLSNRIYWNNK